MVRSGTFAVLFGIVASLLIPAALPAARALDAGAIATGGRGSTSHHFGRDVADLAGRFGIRLRVAPSRGGPEIVEALLRRLDARLGIVRSDLLDTVAGFSEEAGRYARDSLRVVLPLYAEEVHVLARPGVATLADLRGRRVAVGAPGSDTLLAATLLLARAGVEPAAAPRIGGEEALAALREGRVDAMVHVAAQPAALLRDKVAIEDALRLVPVEHPALRGLYPASTIPAGTYHPWQPRAVPTVASRAVLVTPHWAGSGDQGDEEACRLVGEVARIVADNLGRLRRHGHPGWRGVDLGVAVPGWERSPCAERALAGPDGHVLDETGSLRPPRTSRASPEAATREDPAR